MSSENIETQTDGPIAADELSTEAASEPATDLSSKDKLAPALRRIGAIAAIVVAAAGFYFGWRYFSAPADTDEPSDQSPVVRVRTAKAEVRPIANEVSAVGTIAAARQSVVSANSAGQVSGLGILQNEFVKKGELLATINTRDLQAQKKEAESMLKEASLNAENLKRSSIPQSEIQAEKDLRDARAAVENARNLYSRRKDLYEKGGISLKDVEAAELAFTQAEDNLRYVESSRDLRTGTSNSLELRTARARVAQAEIRIKTLQAQISLAEIRAPISGIVIFQKLFDGEFAQPGTEVVTIADISEVIVKAGFPDTVLSGIKEGDPVTVRPNDLPGETMAGKVSLVSRSADPANRASEVWVRLANGTGRLRIGGAAEVIIGESSGAESLAVPVSAVVLDGADSNSGVVMVVDAGSIARERKVTVGTKTGSLIEIVSGLKAGETVITEGNYALPDGTKVTIADNAKTSDEVNR